MQHFGVDSWAGVEAQFQDGGSHGGMWGCLHMLQQGESGSGIAAMQIYYTPGAAGTSSSELHGVFQRSSSGIISVALSKLKSGNATYSYDAGISLSEQVFASFALNSSAVYGGYRLDNGISGSPSTVHNHLYVDPSQLTLTALKAGTGFGPIIAEASPHPLGKAVGKGYQLVGWTTTILTDYVIPAMNSDSRTMGFNFVVELIDIGADFSGPTGKRVSPYIGPAVDTYQSICFDTGCPR